jgi:HSP20 family molecular chaperone IbpA
MAFFPIHRYRLIDDPFDFFDPWQDFDTSPTTLVIGPTTFRWVNQPQGLTHGNQSGQPSSVSHPEKFRVQLNVAGFDPKTINTKVEGRKVIVEAKQEDRQSDGDYNIRQLRKTYELPEHAGK